MESNIKDLERLLGAIHIGNVNQINFGGGNTYIERQELAKDSKAHTASSLAEMIDSQWMDLYKKQFNELLAPYIIGDDTDPMTVVDMTFSHQLKKDSIYRAFNIIANYIKSDYSLPDLANYMQIHIEGMPQKIDSILRQIRKQ